MKLKRSARFGLFAFAALLLCLALCSLPLSRSSAYADTRFVGEGTAESPYLIEDESDLSDLSSLVNNGSYDASGQLYAGCCYRLTDDIALSSAWTPIGLGNSSYILYLDATATLAASAEILPWGDLYSSFYTDKVGTAATDVYDPSATYYYYYSVDNCFFGTFDGFGHTLSGLNFSSSNKYGGLFGRVRNATIKNVTVASSTMTVSAENSCLGAVCGRATDSRFLCCVSDGNTLTSSRFVGGILGYFGLSEEVVSVQSVSLDAFYSEYIGSPQTPSLSSCLSKDGTYSASAAQSCAGGILGYTQNDSTTVSDCMNGSLASAEYAGGVLAYHTDTVNVTRCLGIRSSDTMGALFDEADYDQAETYKTYFTYCYFDSEVAADNEYFSSTPYSLLYESNGLKSNGWNVSASSNNTFFYPTVPSLSVDISFEGYTISVDSSVKELHHKDQNVNFTLPAASTKSGYTFSHWSDGKKEYAAASVASVSAQSDFVSVWDFNQPTLTPNTDAYASVYDGDSHSLSVVAAHGLSAAVFEYQWSKNNVVLSNTTSSYSVKNVTDSGVYQCTVTATNPTTSESSDNSVSFTVTVSPLGITLLQTLASTVYTGTATDLDAVYSIVEPISYPAGDDPGITTVATLSTVPSDLLDSGEYVLTFSTTDSNYSVSPSTMPFTVLPATLIYTVTPPENPVYTGNATVFTADLFSVTTVNSQTATVLFGITSSVSDSSLSVTDAGNYTVYYEISAPNHTAQSGSFPFAVTPATLSCTVQDTSYTYDGYGHGISVTDAVTVNAQTATVLYSTDGKNYGTNGNLAVNVTKNGTVVYFKLSAPNHSDYYGQATVTVLPLTITPQAAASYLPIEKTYDGSYACALSALSSDLFTATYAEEYLGLQDAVLTPISASFLKKDAGNTSVNVLLSCDGNHTLSVSTVSLLAKINPAILTLSGGKEGFSLSKTYNGSVYGTDANAEAVLAENGLYSLTLNSAAEFVPSPAVTYYASIEAIENDTPTSHTDATVATVSFYVDSNYIWADASYFTVSASVVPAELTVTLTATDRPYDGTTDVTLTVTDHGDTFAGETILFDTLVGTIPSPNASDEPYEVQYGTVTSDSADYTYTVQNAVTVTVSPANPVLSVAPSEQTVYLTASFLPDPVWSGAEGTLVWDYSPEDGVALSVTLGEPVRTENKISVYSVGWIFTSSDSNYNSATGNCEVSVSDEFVQSIYAVTTNAKTVYNALESFSTDNLIVYAHCNSGYEYAVQDECIVLYPTESDKLVFGDTAVTVRYTDITESFDCSIAVTVNKNKITVPTVNTVYKNYYTYSGNEIVLRLNNFDADPSTALLTVTGNTAIDAGTHEAIVSIKDAQNYAWTDGTTAPVTLPWTIERASRYPLTLSADSFSYTGEEITVTVLNENNADKSFYTVAPQSVLSATAGGTYRVYIDFIDENYRWSDGEEELILTWEILPFYVKKPIIYESPYTYNKKMQTVKTDAEFEYYTLGGNLTATNVGEYVVTATLKNGDGANFLWEDGTDEPIELTYSVLPLAVAFETPRTLSFEYTGENFSVIIPSSEDYTVDGTTIKSNVGEYQIIVALKDRTNTVWKDNGLSENKLIRWKITPIKVDKPTVMNTLEYNGVEQKAPIPRNAYYTLTNDSGKAAGTYTTIAKLLPNTCWSDGTYDNLLIAWEIKRAVIAKPEQPESIRYDGFEHTAYIEPNNAYTVTGNTGKEAGTYTATVTLNDTDGYCWTDGTTEPLAFTWGIYKISSTVDLSSYTVGTPLPSLSKQGYTFDGWYLSPDFSESSKVTSIDSLDSNVTLYPKWTETTTSDEETPTVIDGGGTTSSGGLSQKVMIGLIVLAGCVVLAVLIIILGKAKGGKGGGDY